MVCLWLDRRGYSLNLMSSVLLLLNRKILQCWKHLFSVSDKRDTVKHIWSNSNNLELCECTIYKWFSFKVRETNFHDAFYNFTIRITTVPPSDNNTCC